MNYITLLHLRFINRNYRVNYPACVNRQFAGHLSNKKCQPKPPRVNRPVFPYSLLQQCILNYSHNDCIGLLHEHCSDIGRPFINRPYPASTY